MLGASLETMARFAAERHGVRPSHERWRWIAGRRYVAPHTFDDRRR
jgi:hypothetical protein